MHRRLVALASALLLPLVAAPVLTPADAAPAPAPTTAVAHQDRSGTPLARAAQRRKLIVRVLSNRADLVSEGDARVAVTAAKGVRLRSIRVFVGRREVTKRFAVRPTGRYEGIVRGLRVGRNVVTARWRGHRARAVVTNHPAGGPLFSGPQLKHYRCQATARDAQCNQPATYSLLYRSTNPLAAALQPYDRTNPPNDVATTTTDRGVRVPFIVRREDGFQDRDRYTILTLWQPGKPWAPWRPQRQFNGKVLVTHGGGCGASYSPGTPPLEDYSGTIPAETPGFTQSYVTALGKGFSVISTALDNTGHNCNVAMNAESLVMAKERFVERYGTIRYTIGTGCSGGSIAQHTVANAYPGIYQGLITTCSYPDTLTAGAQFADYHLMRRYFEDPSRWGPGVAWLPTQMADVEGHLTHLNAVVADEGLFKSALNPEDECGGTTAPVAGDPATRYDSEINPGGVRCSVLDLMVNLIGPRPSSVWTPQEKRAGRGFGGIPFANAGIQYGLEALKAGRITTAQFLDLNEKLGGLDVDSQPIAGRTVGDPASVARAYRTGLVNLATNLDQVAMINFGGPDPGLAHDYAHAFWTEERLRRDQGHTDNRVMWFGAVPLIGDLGWANDALVQMDRWLSRVERDGRAVPLARKVVQDKPADLTDRCTNVPGVGEVPGAGDEVDCVLPESLQLRLSTPREMAGDDVHNDRLSCRLTPLERSAYGFLLVPLTDAEWARLQAVFPRGVCDYSRPGLGSQPAQTWLAYADARGRVVHGGRNLPSVPAASGEGWSSPSFRGLLHR
ncbi:DUF6351 family protein [Nocardioides sp. cx-173]|uniref:DUF6351 family protein n=1 Tax=Nocardioides sp. cx-173 TaxID=2898796 RepID=UPI001E5B423E|nr:DUF6351 family protein [Nocardioides sp. cx-173]MCD4524343.1 DUF6351 family protein [Nocardioides sp. cx-173]UGB41731.1 DUF6351 family protein [Nocardioides sp. cx-173]